MRERTAAIGGAAWAGLVTALAALCAGPARAGEGAVKLETDPLGATLKAADGRPVLRYVTRKPEESKLTANSVCCFHPLWTPSGVPVTDFAPDDHRHHRGVFLAWYAMHGAKDADFWGWGQFAPTKGRVIEFRGIKAQAGGIPAEDLCHLSITTVWLADGEPMVQESTQAAVRERDKAFVIDLAYSLTPTADTKLDQSAFAGFCVRSRKDGKFAFFGPDGGVKLPDPHYLKPETDWPAADWYGYAIELKDGRTAGVAVIDHPGNPPTRWHNNRGAWMLNPCVTAAGPLTLKKGESFLLRYRLVVHDGPTPTERVNALSAEWRKR